MLQQRSVAAYHWSHASQPTNEMLAGNHPGAISIILVQMRQNQAWSLCASPTTRLSQITHVHH